MTEGRLATKRNAYEHTGRTVCSLSVSPSWIARNLLIGLLAADLDGWVWFCNPAATEWLQATVSSNLSVCLIPEWISENLWQSDLQALEQQRSVASRVCQRGDRWFELQLEPLIYQPEAGGSIDSNHQPDGFLMLLEDITSKKQIEVSLEQQVQELQRVAQLKDDFLSTVSHELRSPIANIKMAIELLKISRSEAASAQYLKILQTGCARETNLINDLLDLQRLEAGAQNYSNPKSFMKKREGDKLLPNLHLVLFTPL